MIYVAKPNSMLAILKSRFEDSVLPYLYTAYFFLIAVIKQ